MGGSRNGSELSAENGPPLNADRHSVAAIRSAARPDGRVLAPAVRGTGLPVRNKRRPCQIEGSAAATTNILKRKAGSLTLARGWPLASHSLRQQKEGNRPIEREVAGTIKQVFALKCPGFCSRKADRNLDRKALRRHGKASKRGLSDELVPCIYLHSFKKLGKFCYQFLHLHDILCQAIFHKTWSVSGIIPKIYLWILRHHGLVRNPIMTSFRIVRRSGPRRIALLRFFSCPTLTRIKAHCARSRLRGTGVCGTRARENLLRSRFVDK